MEDQGKKLLLTVAIVCAIMIGWQFLFPPDKPTEKKEGAPPSEVAKPEAPSGAAAVTPPAAPVAEAVPRGPEKTVELANPQFKATFSSYGATLTSWKLLGKDFHVHGGKEPEDLVRSSDPRLRPFQLSFADSTYPIAPDAEWTVREESANRVVFAYESGPLAVTKSFTIHPADYFVELTVEASLAAGAAAGKQQLVIALGSFQDPKLVKSGGMAGVAREWKAACFANGKLETWGTKALTGQGKTAAGDIGWVGFTYPYFITALALEPKGEQVICRATDLGGEPGPMLVEARYASAELQPGTPFRRTVAGYFGPKYMGKLQAVSTALGWENRGLERAIDLGWLGFLARPLLWLLNFFFGLVQNWPLSIVLLTITVKLATLYWTHKSMKSMKAMARLRPELDKLKEKYQDDRQRQQVETMNLFKAAGVNPLAGCLPMVLQMPIWFALYRALSVAAELYQAKFLWIHDLTAADPFFILPVFMTGMMLVQSLLTPTTASGAQQKMLSYGMPIIFGAMSLFFPAGLTLYISTNSILTLLHHLYMRADDKKAPPAGEVEMAAEAIGAAIDAESSEVAGDDDEGGGKPAKRKPSGTRKKRGGRR